VDGLGKFVVDYTNRYTSFFGSDTSKISSPNELANLGSLNSIAGTVFETAVTQATNSTVAQAARKGGASATIDFVNPNPELRSLFNNMPGDYEAKYSESLGYDVIRKGLTDGYLKAPPVEGKKGKKVKSKAAGYIPNFANPNLIQEVSKRASLVNSNITKKLKEGSGLKDEAYIKAAQKLGVNVTGLEKFMTPMSFPLKGKDKVLNLSKALGTSFGRSFTLDALKMGDWDYVKPQFESAGYTKDDFSKLSKFASTPKGASALKFWKSRASGYIPNFANRRVGYLDGDVLSDPRYEATVAEEIKKLGLKGGLPEYHKYLGDMAKKARKSGSIKKFTGIFGVPGAGKSTMMLGGKNAEKADNAKARKTERIPIITPKDIGRVDEIIDTRASLVGTTKALEGGYWSGLDRLMIMSSSTPEEQKEIKRRRDLRDSQILQGKSNTAFGRSAGTSQGASLDSGYIEAMALSVLGPNKTRVMGINENFKLKRKKGDELPLVEKKQIGLSYGAFSPSTRGHLDMMEMAKKQGISPEDFIVAVSKEGGKIDPKDPHSFRTAIFDQKTRKYLAKKTFTGANVIGANSDLFTGGTIPKMLEVDPVGKRRKFLSAKSGSMAFVGSDKQEKDLQKYKDAGYKVNVGERTEGISGTDARAAILAGDSKLISKIFADHVISTINQIGPNIKNRADVFPEILSRINSKLDKRLDPILAELSTLPSRITKTTPEEVAVKIQGLREQRDKYQKLKQYLPTKFIKKLSGIFPQKYGIPNAAEGYIPNFANALSDSIGRELQESGLPKSQIYVAQKDALVSGANPTGLGVFNKRDEGSVTSENKAIRNKSKGYIPNFANGADASATGTVDKFNSSLQSLTGQVENTTEAVQNEGPSLAANLAAVGTQLGSLAFYLNYNKEDYQKSIIEMAKANRQAARDQLNAGEITKETFDKIKNTKVDGKVPTSMKLKAGLKGAGGPLAFAAPVIAETIANSIPQNSKAGRVGASAASSVGQIGAFAGTGAMIGSAIAPGAGTLVGAGLGAAAGALLSLPDIIGQLSTDMPELSAAALKSSQELNQLNNGASTVLQAYEDYQNALAGDNQELINKTRKNFAASLNGLTEEQKKSVLSAGSLNKASEALAAISNKKAKEFADLKLAQDFGDVGQSFMKQFGVSFKSKEQDTFVKSKFAETSMASGQFKSAEEVRGNKLSTVDSRQKFDETLQNLNIGEPIKKALSGLADTSLIGAIGFLNQALEQTAQQFEDTADIIDGVKKSAENAFNKLKQTLTKEVQQAAAILQKNADNILNFNKTMNSYKLSEMDFSKSRTSSSLSGRQERAVALTGEDSALSLKKTIDVQLNKISSTRESTNQATGQELQESILQNLLKPISDASDKGDEEGGGGGAINNLLSAIGASSYGQKSGTKSALDLAQAGGGFQNLLNTLNTDLGSKISELLKPRDEKGGLIDDSAIISELQKIASELGLSAQDQAAFSTQVTNAVNAANSSIVATNQTAKQQTQVVAKEATQKVAMQNLQKSLKVFGGADSVINPIDENPFMSAAQESTQPVNDILQKIGQNVKQGPGSFEATNSGSGGYIYKKGKEEMGEEGGRNILQLIKSMQDMSGGLYKPDANSKEYKLGVDTIEKDINAKIASLKNMASTTESGTAKGVIESMIKSLTSQPGGVRGIAENQMAQLTGTMDEKKFDKNADKSEAAAEKQVAKAAPGLADAQKEAEARDQKTISAFKSIFEGQQQSSNAALSGISSQIQSIIDILNTPPPTPPEPEKPEAPKPAEPLPEGFMDKVVNVFRSFFSDPVTAARMAPGGGGLPPLPPPVTTAPATKVDAKPITPSVNDGTYDPALVDKFTTGKNAPATTGSVTGAPITPVKTETIGGDAVSSLGSEIKSLNTNLGTWNQALVDKFSAGQNTNTKDGSKDAGPAAGAGATGGTSQTNNVSVDLAVNVDGVNNINQQLDTQIAEVKKQIAAVMEKLNIKQAPVVGGGGGSTMVA
jgi:hypothetical protein